MACQIGELESDAVEARQDLAERRSTFPKVCSNLLMKTLKSDIKTQMTFVVDTGMEKSSVPDCKNYEHLVKRGLFEERSLSYQKLDGVEEHLTQVTKALNIISKNKPKRMCLGDQSN